MLDDNKSFLEDDFSFDDLKLSKKPSELSKFDNFTLTVEDIFDKTRLKIKNKTKTIYIKLKTKYVQFDAVTRVLVTCGVMFIVVFLGTSVVVLQKKIEEHRAVAVFAPNNIVIKPESPYFTGSIFDEGNIKKVLVSNLGQFQNIRLKYNNNQDITSYLYILGTNINTPVAQTIDNTFYLDHDLYKNSSVNGTIYIDATSEIENLGRNTVIFGRSDIVGEQFADLSSYEDENFYKQNRYINFDTVYRSTVWQVYSFYKNCEDNFYMKTDFTDEEFKTFVVNTKNLSIYDNDVVVDEDDKILTLTSTNSSGDKYILQAKLYRTN